MPKYTTNAPETEVTTNEPHKYCTNPECTRAGQLLPFSDFFRDKYAQDSRTHRCKKCITIYRKRYEQTDSWKKAHARYMRSEKGKAAVTKHVRSEKGKLSTRTRMANRRKTPTHQPKELARRAVFSAVRARIIPKAKELLCQRCEKPAIEYHHYLGYDPEHYLDVIPVCKACHTEIHTSPTDE